MLAVGIGIVLNILFLEMGWAQTSNMTPPGTAISVKVEILNIKPVEAERNIVVALYQERDFLKRPLQQKSVVARANKVDVTLDIIPGRYCLSVYYDTNGNHQLDRWFYGKPKEPYAFSNKYQPMGKPSFSGCAIQIDDRVDQVTLSLHN